MLFGRFLGLAVAVVAIAMTRTARGEEPAEKFTVDLEYAAVADCPDREAFGAIVSERLGYEAFQADAKFRVRVHIEPSNRGFEGHIEWRNAGGESVGERTFSSHSSGCRDLARAVAFALALQIQFSAATGVLPGATPEGEKPPEPPIEPPAPPTPPPAPLPAPPAPRPSPALDVGVGISIARGLQSSVVPLGRLFGGVAWSHALLEVAAEAGAPSTARREDGAGVSQQVFFLSVAGCATLSRWGACWLAKGGAIRVRGIEIDDPVTAWAAGFATGPRLSFRQPLFKGIYLAAHASGMINLTPWLVRLDSTTVWAAPRFAEIVGLDLGMRFE